MHLPCRRCGVQMPICDETTLWLSQHPEARDRVVALCTECFRTELERLESDPEYGADDEADRAWWNSTAPLDLQLDLFA